MVDIDIKNRDELMELYDENADVVLQAASHYLNHKEFAEDIMHDTFLKLYERYDSMRKTNIRAWLTTTAKHMALNHNNRTFRHVHTSETELEKSDRTTINNLEDGVIIKEHNESIEEFQKNLFEALEAKNSRWYEAIELVCVCHKTYQEAADEMNMTKDAFSMMLYRAKKWIAKNYESEFHQLKY